MSNSRKVILKGSDRVPLPGTLPIGSTGPRQLIEISVILPYRQALQKPAPMASFEPPRVCRAGGRDCKFQRRGWSTRLTVVHWEQTTV